jgi:hypothetical protein
MCFCLLCPYEVLLCLSLTFPRSSLTRSEAPNTQGTGGLRHEEDDRDSGLGVSEGEPKNPEKIEASEQSRPSMVEGAATEVGVEQARAGERGRVRVKGVGHILRSKQAVTDMVSNHQRHCVATGISRGGSPKPRGYQQAGKESERRVERRVHRRTPDLRGGSVNLQK